MEAIVELAEKIPQSVFLALAGLGALVVGTKVLAYLSFVVNVFVLSGTSVSLPWPSLSRIELFLRHIMSE